MDSLALAAFLQSELQSGSVPATISTDTRYSPPLPKREQSSLFIYDREESEALQELIERITSDIDLFSSCIGKLVTHLQQEGLMPLRAFTPTEFLQYAGLELLQKVIAEL